jgi:amino acid transporter
MTMLRVKKENSNMKERKNRLSKLSIVAFVIVSFCAVSVTTQSSQAYTLGMSDNEGFISIIWSYFFPATNNDKESLSGKDTDPTETPSQGERTPNPQTASTIRESSCGKLRCKNP